MSQAVNENPTIEEQTWHYGRAAARLEGAEKMREACLAICADYAKDIKNDAIKQIFAEHVCDKIAARIRALTI